MPRHPLFNAAALAILSLHESPYAAALGTQCRGIHYSAKNPCLWIFLNVATLGPQCCGIGYSANFMISTNAATLNLQCCGIESIFLLLSSFCIFSFFFRFQCSSYHLQHKIPRKSVQNANNAIKITKYWDLKYIKFHYFHPLFGKHKTPRFCKKISILDGFRLQNHLTFKRKTQPFSKFRRHSKPPKFKPKHKFGIPVSILSNEPKPF